MYRSINRLLIVLSLTTLHGGIEISQAQFHASPDQAPKSVTTVITIAASTVVRFQDTEADVEIEVDLAASLVVKSSTESDIEHFVAATKSSNSSFLDRAAIFSSALSYNRYKL